MSEILPSKLTLDTIRCFSFNVCGLRNLFKYYPWSQEKTLENVFKLINADIICFQEVRTQQKDLPYNMAVVPGYTGFHTFPQIKKGYSGVAVYIRNSIKILHAEDGISGTLKSLDFTSLSYKQIEQEDLNEFKTKLPHRCIGGYPVISDNIGRDIDSEGRSLVLDLGFCVLFGLYCPANSLGNKEEFRNMYFKILDERVNNLRKLGREVIIMGDINVSREIYDSSDGLSELIRYNPLAKLILEHSDIEKFNNDFKNEVAQWRESTAQKKMMSEWLTTNSVDYEKSFDSSLLRDVCREKHPQRFSMYTCKFYLLSIVTLNCNNTNLFLSKAGINAIGVVKKTSDRG